MLSTHCSSSFFFVQYFISVGCIWKSVCPFPVHITFQSFLPLFVIFCFRLFHSHFYPFFTLPHYSLPLRVLFFCGEFVCLLVATRREKFQFKEGKKKWKECSFDHTLHSFPSFLSSLPPLTFSVKMCVSVQYFFFILNHIPNSNHSFPVCT